MKNLIIGIMTIVSASSFACTYNGTRTGPFSQELLKGKGYYPVRQGEIADTSIDLNSETFRSKAYERGLGGTADNLWLYAPRKTVITIKMVNIEKKLYFTKKKSYSRLPGTLRMEAAEKAKEKEYSSSSRRERAISRAENTQDKIEDYYLRKSESTLTKLINGIPDCSDFN